MAAALSIGALVEAVTAIATIVTQTGKIVNEIQPRKKVSDEQIDKLKTQIDELEDSTKQIGQVAATLGAYVQSYVDVNPIATECERLLVYLRENSARLDKETSDAWSVAYFMFRDIDKEASSKYRLSALNQSGLLDPEDWGYIQASVSQFEKATNQARTCIEHKLATDLLRHIEGMDEASRDIPNVLADRINRVLIELSKLS